MAFRSLLMSVLAALALSAPWQALMAATPLATVSIVEGSGATVIRDAAKFALAEGVRLSADDIIETGAAARLVRIEFNDGLMLDLGSETRAQLSPRLSGDKSRAATRLYLLGGVVKLSLSKGSSPVTGVLSSPMLDVGGLVRSAVLALQSGQEVAVFAESGEVSLQERVRDDTPQKPASKAGALVNLKSGEFFAHKEGEKAAITQRSTPAFIQKLPRPFLDALPSRAQLFKDREVQPRRLGDISYADVSAWIDADGLRSGFVTRWKALAQDADFRQGLITNLRAHPEWDRTLYPEKYLPKPKPGASSAGLAASVAKP